MPYIWIALVVFFGVRDEVFIVATVTLWAWLTMWVIEELRVVGERITAFNSRIALMTLDELRAEVKP